MLYEESLGHLRTVHLSSERLYTVHDLLLVPHEGDAQGDQVFESECCHLVHGGEACLQEVVDVALHLYGRQPVLNAVVTREVGYSRVEEVVRSETNQHQRMNRLFSAQVVHERACARTCALRRAHTITPIHACIFLKHGVNYNTSVSLWTYFI